MIKDGIKLISGTTIPNICKDDNDLFCTKERAASLLNLLTKNKNLISDIKMIGLYGEWGSGKTTYIKYIHDEIKTKHKKDYSCVFFEAWKYEFDNNLNLSLFECITNRLIKDSESVVEEKTKKILAGCYMFIKNLAYNTSISLGVPGGDGISFDIGQAGRDTVEEFQERYRPMSLYGRLEEFNANLKKLLDKLLYKGEELIVFIDDLDRCSPENVLNLMSFIKHFFTFDDRLRFIFAVDKEAVGKALKVKYGDVIKSNEYVEKLFDLNLSINPTSNYYNLIDNYFNLDDDDDDREDLIHYIETIELTNPRRLIKVLNRMIILINQFDFEKNSIIRKLIRKEDGSQIEVKPIISDLGYKNNKLFYKIMIYYIFLKEFYEDEFRLMDNMHMKMDLFYRNRLSESKEFKISNYHTSFHKLSKLTDIFFNSDSINNIFIKNEERMLTPAKVHDNWMSFVIFNLHYNSSFNLIENLLYTRESFRSILNSLEKNNRYSYNFLNYIFYDTLYNEENEKIVDRVIPKDVIRFSYYNLYKFIKNN